MAFRMNDHLETAVVKSCQGGCAARAAAIHLNQLCLHSRVGRGAGRYAHYGRSRCQYEGVAQLDHVSLPQVGSTRVLGRNIVPTTRPPRYRQPMSLDTEAPPASSVPRTCISRLSFRNHILPRIDHLCRVMSAGSSDRDGAIFSIGLDGHIGVGAPHFAMSTIDVARPSAITLAA